MRVWPLPTSDIPDTYIPGLLPFGLVRYQIEAADLYGCAWVQEVAGGAGSAVLVGAWNALTRALLWSTNFGITTSPWTNPDLPYSCRFFHEPTHHWMFALPLPSGFPPEIFSARSAEEIAHHTIDKPSHNVSINSWSEPDVSEIDMTAHPTRIWMCLPYCGAGPVAGEKVDFWFFDEIAKAWGSNGVWMAAEDVPVGGAALVPDLIGNGAAFGGPVAWLGQEALVIVTGGTRDILAAGRWLEAHWTCRSIKVDGTPGILAKSKTIVATLPTALEPSSLKTEIMAGAYPMVLTMLGAEALPGDAWSWDIGTFRWDSGCRLGTDSEVPNYMHTCPIALPAAYPNTGRMLSLSSRVESGWPSQANMGGGAVVDEAGTVWTCILEPEQVLYGGYYTDEYIDDLPAWWLEEEAWHCLYGHRKIGGWVDSPSRTLTYAVSGNSAYSMTVSVGADASYDGDCTGEWGGDMFWKVRLKMYDSVTPGQHFRKVWNQKNGTIRRTILRGHRADDSTVEADISQLLDADHTGVRTSFEDMVFHSDETGSWWTGHTVGVTQPDYPLPDNVWQMLSFPEAGILSILRDLHADGADNNPTPHIEIWRVDITTPAKLSTVRLGSYDEKKTSDNTDFEPHWKDGDQEWDPYAIGAPRMKGCRDSLTNAPIIVAMVGEAKKVDPETDSQFKRCCYATINCANPSSPEVVRSAQTSPDEGVGPSGEVPGNGPLWQHWDTLLLTTGRVAWIRDSEFREAG